MLYALGLQDKIVGVDTTSQWPPEAQKDKKSVGYVRALSAEGVLSLKPSQVIAVEGAGPPDAFALLKESGTPITMIPEALTPEAVVAKIAAIGKAAGAAEPAQQLAASVKTRFDELDRLRTGLPKQKRVLFVLSLQNGRTMVGGRNSTADAIIALAGGINAASAVEGFKPMTDEAIITAAPDVVLMMRFSSAHNATPDELFVMPAFSQTPAAKQKALIRMDGLYLLGFGPRTPNAARDLMAEALSRGQGRPALRREMTLAMKQMPVASAAALALLTAGHRRKSIIAVSALVVFCLLLMLVSLGAGAFAIAPGRVADILFAKLGFGPADLLDSREALVVLNIRMPRLLLGALVGAALAISGALMQGLFRNPLADPGLVGVSAGAGLAAAATIVLGDRFFLSAFAMKLPFAMLPFGAFFGGLVSTLALYLIATRQGRTSVATMLLAGVALGALAGSLTGLLAFISDDRQLRDLTFWSLGSLGGASWTKLSVVAPIVLPLLFAVPLLARGLNALMLGEAEAYHLGVPVQRIKALAILLVALAVGASVASAGVIGFVGIVVPHLIRLSIGPDHRLLLPLSAIGGAALLVGADIVARLAVVPAELPIGIVTAFIGAPFFLWLLLRRGRIAEL